MKTLGRVIIILLALTIVMGIIYLAVDTNTSSSGAQLTRFERSERPESPDRERGERFESGGFGWVFGAIKNTAIISIIVALIVVPKGWLQRRKRQHQINGA